ncbi:MAG: DNA-binding response regulator [Acidobacteria bacterium]|nr:MAG: DNA-binding response regulator [Acidobacteriota bacterium]
MWPITHIGDEISRSKWNNLKVLIVDDSPGLRLRLADMLKTVAGLTVVGLAHGVADAYRAIHELSPNLVVLDLQLSDGNGIEVLQATKRVNPSIRFVIFTNQSDSQYRQRCAELGADYFLCKSTEAKSLLMLIEGLVSKQ